jgi:hypothetical protein
MIIKSFVAKASGAINTNIERSKIIFLSFMLELE